VCHVICHVDSRWASGVLSGPDARSRRRRRGAGGLGRAGRSRFSSTREDIGARSCSCTDKSWKRRGLFSAASAVHVRVGHDLTVGVPRQGDPRRCQASGPPAEGGDVHPRAPSSRERPAPRRRAKGAHETPRRSCDAPRYQVRAIHHAHHSEVDRKRMMRVLVVWQLPVKERKLSLVARSLDESVCRSRAHKASFPDIARRRSPCP